MLLVWWNREGLRRVNFYGAFYGAGQNGATATKIQFQFVDRSRLDGGMAAGVMAV